MHIADTASETGCGFTKHGSRCFEGWRARQGSVMMHGFSGSDQQLVYSGKGDRTQNKQAGRRMRNFRKQSRMHGGASHIRRRKAKGAQVKTDGRMARRYHMKWLYCGLDQAMAITIVNSSPRKAFMKTLYKYFFAVSSPSCRWP